MARIKQSLAARRGWSRRKAVGMAFPHHCEKHGGHYSTECSECREERRDGLEAERDALHEELAEAKVQSEKYRKLANALDDGWEFEHAIIAAKLSEAQSHIRGLAGKAQQVAAMLRSVTAKSGTWIAQHPEEVYSICDTSDALLTAGIGQALAALPEEIP